MPTTHFANSGVGPTAESFPRRWHELRQPSMAGEARRLRAVVEEERWVRTAAPRSVGTDLRALSPHAASSRRAPENGLHGAGGRARPHVSSTLRACPGAAPRNPPQEGSTCWPPPQGAALKVLQRPAHLERDPPCKAHAGKGQAPSLSQAGLLIPEAPGPGPPPRQGSASMTK